MKYALNVAAASINTTALAIQENQQRIVQCIKEADALGVELVVLPELCLSGYGCEDMFLSQGFNHACLASLVEISGCVPEGMVVSVGLPYLSPEGAVYNACALLASNQIIGLACKSRLAKDGVHYEPRWFTSWPAGVRQTVTINDSEVPIGDVVFELAGIRVGYEICEDAWGASRPGQRYFEQGVDILLNPSASHFAIGKHPQRMQLVKEGSRAFGCVYIYANLMGCEAGRIVYDGGNLIASEGELVKLGERFSFKPYHLTIATVDVEANRAIRVLRAHQPYTSPGLSPHSVPGFAFRARSVVSINAPQPLPVVEPLSDVIKAIALGLWDWQCKTKQKGFVVSLSGGADSALCAVLVNIAHRYAFTELGLQAYKKALIELGIATEKLEHLADPIQAQVMAAVLTTVYQSTRNSSATTEHAAATLANALGAQHHVWSVEEEVQRYCQKAEKALQRPLNWQQDDIALQNIQARARAPGVWLLANVEQKLLLTTSNLTEASVGYCTMDGDTAGVLAPIGGVSKSLVLKLNRFLCEQGLLLPDGHLLTFPALSVINNQPPTAELRPTPQQDELDLMPFEVLDTIRHLAQVGFLTPAALLLRLEAYPFEHAYSKEQLAGWVNKYVRLYSRNQWKRERLAVSFHIERDSACPKTYRRFPVLNNLDKFI